MRSIRETLLATTVGGSLVVVAAGGLVLHGMMESALESERDRALEETVRFLASTINVSADGVDVEIEEMGLEELERDEERSAFTVWNLTDGEVLYTTPEDALPLRPVGTGASLGYRDERSPDDRPFRTAALRFTPRIDIDEEDAPAPSDSLVAPELAIVLARDATRLHVLLDRLTLLILGVGLAIGALILVVATVAVGRGLAPLGRVARAIDDVDVEGTPEPLAIDGVPRELDLVVRRLNALVARVADAIARERTFSADVAHELRTPLAGLRTTIEVELAQPRDGSAYVAALEASLDIVVRLQRISEALLTLCRIEAGAVPRCRERTDVGRLVASAWAPHREAARQKSLQTSIDAPPDLHVVTDPGLLETAVANLLHNAVSHANSGGRVSVLVRAAGGRTTISIANSGSSVDRDEVPVLMERFARGDRARADTGIHAGLGLALVERIARLLTLELRVDAARGGEFRVELRIPPGPPPTGGAYA